MDLISTGTKPWILEYDACERVAREIMEHLNSCDNEKVSQAQDVLSAKIRIRLKQVSNEVSEFHRKLNATSVVNSIIPGERERRKRQVEIIQSKEVQLRDFFNSRREDYSKNTEYNKSKTELFKKSSGKSAFDDVGTTSWGEAVGTSSSAPYGRSIQEMKEEQERLLEEQNKGLESLLKVVSTQTQIATSINNKVEHHNDILVHISGNMENIDGRLNRATDLIKVIGKKKSIWGYWLIALRLFIVILAVTFA